jgi:hypothetical protein
LSAHTIPLKKLWVARCASELPVDWMFAYPPRPSALHHPVTVKFPTLNTFALAPSGRFADGT